MSTELEQIAASVAKALGFRLAASKEFYTDGKDLLDVQGDWLFAPAWQVRCRDWLLEHKHNVTFNYSKSVGHWMDMPVSVHLQCPAAEFCARAIHELMTKP